LPDTGKIGTETPRAALSQINRKDIDGN